MPAGANSRTPATDFVQDYAAKRQAQMERARQLREDRLQQQQQRQSSPQKSGGGNAYNSSPKYTAVPSASGGGTATAAPTSRQPPPPSLNMPRSRHVTPGHGSADSGSSPGKCGDGCVLYIKEQDFKQATQAGIITPDQARQLWAMLSNQIIRVCSPSAHANAVSVSSLLALSNNSYNSSGRAAGGPQSTGGSEFGASISLESLRTSIANTAGQPLSQSRGLPQRQLQYDGNANNVEKPRTGRTSTVRPAVKGPAASSSPAAGASGVFGTSAQGGVGQGGGGYGNDDEEASNNMYMPPQPSSAVPRGAKASGSGAASRRPPASRLTAPPPSSGAPVNLDEAAAVAQEPMQECRTCGRRFRISVVMRHEALCRNQANKPRKVFNMREQRLEGVEGIKEWKVQHEQFQAAMRAVRQQKEAGGGFGFGQMAPPPAPIPEEYDDRVPCPHCGRKFAQEVAARHIPKCATTIAKPKGIRPIRR
ncbi:zinc-finger of a C2HC-type family protein [Leishmania donovani]|uniref:Zinc-finger of a C2HC-type family protein n=1 Tax=Leishmania donovani TaxID=5661 RepID=A0A504XW39_LEIDO|nr:zinc-finger of a C2HC-type family protein [Leishmania donovani]